MLQWMGGSRRKVTTSRKSTYKRQKQYFEQRKRQQQQQPTTESENYGDGMNTCSQHQNEQRSLDVLSLLNWSTVSQDCRSACPSGKEDLRVNGSTVKYDFTKGPSTTINHTINLNDSVNFKEAGSPSHCQMDAASPQKVLLSSHDDNSTLFNGTGAKLDHWKTATEQYSSVLDLLGGDEPNGNKERSPTQEAHVAFSVEGLGKVGTETPVHSPQQPGRYCSLGCSSPLKAARDPNMLNNHNHFLDDLELEVDALMQDTNMPRIGSSSEFSSGIMHSYSDSKQKLAAVRDYRQHYGHDSKRNGLFGDSRIFYDRENTREIWDGPARSCFLDDNFLDERECDVSRKNWPSEIDGESLDFWKDGNSEMLDYNFDGPHLPKKRNAALAMDRFDILESPASFYKNQTSEIDLDFKNPNGARCPILGTKFDFQDVTSQSDWFCFATEDARDTMSMLSEESCSSSAVRGKATSNSKWNSAARQGRRQSNAFYSPQKNYGVKNIFAKESWHKSRNEIGQGNDGGGSGKYTNVSNPSKSIPSFHSNTPLQEKLGPNNSWFCEKGYATAKMNSGFSPFSRNSEKKSLFSGSKVWTEDPSSELLVPESDFDAKSSFDRSKHGECLACSPPGSFITEKFTFHDSPIFSRVEFELDMPDFSPDSKLKGTPPDSSHLTGSHSETHFPEISAEESASVESRIKIQPAEYEKLELMQEICIGNGLYSESKKGIDASSSTSNTCGCKEAKAETPEIMQNLKTIRSPDHAEQASSSLFISDKVESIIEEHEHQSDNEATLPCQNGNKEIQDIFGPQERRIITKTKSNCDTSSCEVMMLQSYVLQLLCVQKILKDASTQDTMKKFRTSYLTIEEDFHEEVKVARPKYKGTRELLNLKSSINYGKDFTSNRRTRSKYKGTRELLNLKSSVNYGDDFTSYRQGKGKVQGRYH